MLRSLNIETLDCIARERGLHEIGAVPLTNGLFGKQDLKGRLIHLVHMAWNDTISHVFHRHRMTGSYGGHRGVSRVCPLLTDREKVEIH